MGRVRPRKGNMMRKANHTEDILPPLLPDDYETLKASIAARGVDVPILVDQNKEIVDGKHRRRACDELHIDCPSIVQHVGSEIERLQLRLQLNCNRRHLNGKQKRAMIATYLKTDPQIGNPELGEIIGCDKKTVETVRRKLESTREIPSLLKLRGKDGKKRRRTRIMTNKKSETDKAAGIVSQVPDGMEIIPIKAAKNTVRRLRLQKKREKAAANAPPWNNKDIRLHHCRFQELAEIAKLVPGSVRLILPDPPYGKDWLPQWEELGQFAAEYLQDGGLLIAHSGIHSLDRVFAVLGKYLTYQWTISSYWTGLANKQYLQQQVVLGKWRPIPVFSKGTPHLTGGFYDTIHVEGKEKEYHDWQQPLGVFERLIEDFSQPGDLVVDPCGGAFTTAVACHRLRRRFIGCDIDKQCVRIGAARLHDERNGKRRESTVPNRVDSDKPVVHACYPRPEVRTFREAVLGLLPATQRL